jgi:hypothetical protein
MTTEPQTLRRVGKGARYGEPEQTVDRGALPTRRRTTRAAPVARGHGAHANGGYRGEVTGLRAFAYPTGGLNWSNP